MKKFLLLLLALLMLCSLTACNGEDESIYEPDLSNLPEVQGHDFAEEIDNYVEDNFNVIYLDEGEKEKPSKAILMQSGSSRAYSSDESVATVSDKGTVKAQGKGTAYILLQYGIIDGESRDDFAAMGTNVDGQCEVYKVIVGKDEGMFSFVPKEMRTTFLITGVFSALIFIAVLTVIIIFIVRNARNRATAVPPFATNPGNTDPRYEAPTNFGRMTCPHCGETLESGSTFCPYCGRKMRG